MSGPLTPKRKIAINVLMCGWFELSKEALARYTAVTGKTEVTRDDPELIKIIEELGSDRSSTYRSLIEVVSIPWEVQWVIHDYEGIESVVQVHQQWTGSHGARRTTKEKIECINRDEDWEKKHGNYDEKFKRKIDAMRADCYIQSIGQGGRFTTRDLVVLHKIYEQTGGRDYDVFMETYINNKITMQVTEQEIMDYEDNYWHFL
jgi:hypothetical protein